MLHSWNVAYQRELGANFTAEVAYVGNHGQDIIQRLDLNAGYVLGADNAGRPQFAPVRADVQRRPRSCRTTPTTTRCR